MGFQNYVALLRDNYRHLIDSKDLCNTAVRDIITEHAGGCIQVSSLDDLINVKRVAKISRHLLQYEPHMLDDVLEKLYQLQCAGLDYVQGETHADTQTMITEAHLQRETGRIARRLFEKTATPQWAELAYHHALTAGQRTEDNEHDYAALAYLEASDAAKKLAKNPTFAEAWYMTAKRAFEIADNPLIVTDALRVQTDAAIAMKDTKNELWLARIYDASWMSSLENIASKERFMHIANALGAANQLYELTSDIQWAQAMYDRADEGITLFHDPLFYGRVGYAAQELFNHSKNPQMLENKYSLMMEGASVVCGDRASELYHRAAHAARHRSAFGKSMKWLQRAKIAYEKSLESCENESRRDDANRCLTRVNAKLRNSKDSCRWRVGRLKWDRERSKHLT